MPSAVLSDADLRALFSAVDGDNNHAGSTYEGNWLGEKKHGYGVWRRDDNLAWYKGNWHENKRHGEGEYHWANDSWYRGEWNFGKRHGRIRVGQFEDP